jgi:hypothetical protein
MKISLSKIYIIQRIIFQSTLVSTHQVCTLSSLTGACIHSESPNFLNSSSWIHRSYEGERPQDDTDPRFQFMDGFLYYQWLLYIPDGPCGLRVL